MAAFRPLSGATPAWALLPFTSSVITPDPFRNTTSPSAGRPGSRFMATSCCLDRVSISVREPGEPISSLEFSNRVIRAKFLKPRSCRILRVQRDDDAALVVHHTRPVRAPVCDPERAHCSVSGLEHGIHVPNQQDRALPCAGPCRNDVGALGWLSRFQSFDPSTERLELAHNRLGDGIQALVVTA